MDSNGFSNIALRMGNVFALLDGGNRLRETSIYIILRW
jgi:hypothetical protein